MKSQILVHDMKYQSVIGTVLRKLENWGVNPQSRVFVYPDYPSGWSALVGANDRVYIFSSWYGEISLEIEPIFGIAANGSFIRQRLPNHPSDTKRRIV